jgi:hypothetical protein
MEIITGRPDLEQVIKLYGSFLPDSDYMLRTFGANRGWIRLSPRLHELTIRLKCQHYPELYQDEARIQAALLRAYFDNDEEISRFVTVKQLPIFSTIKRCYSSRYKLLMH